MAISIFKKSMDSQQKKFFLKILRFNKKNWVMKLKILFEGKYMYLQNGTTDYGSLYLMWCSCDPRI